MKNLKKLGVLLFCFPILGSNSVNAAPKDLVEKKACIIQGIKNNCPSHPELYAKLARDESLIDESKQSSINEGACSQRAEEYAIYCTSSMPITAEFFSQGKSISKTSYSPDNRCVISNLRNNCPLHPEISNNPTGSVFDRARNAMENEAVCKLRAAEYIYYCGAKNPITARFYSRNRLISETVAPVR
jgi:hypothetical protein